MNRIGRKVAAKSREQTETTASLVQREVSSGKPASHDPMTPMTHRGIRAAFVTGCAVLALSTPALAQEVFPPDTNTPPRHHRLQGSETRAVQPAPSAPAASA